MFTSISWGEYIFYLVLLLFIYYSVIAFIYFKWEILAIAGIRRVNPGSQQLSAATLKEHFIIGDDE